MDFHEQRSADLRRAASRPRALEAAGKTRGLLSRYISSRRAPAGTEPVIRIRWGRVVLAIAGLGLLVLGAVRVLR